MKTKGKIVRNSAIALLCIGLLVFAVVKSGTFSAEPKKPVSVAELKSKLDAATNKPKTSKPAPAPTPQDQPTAPTPPSTPAPQPSPSNSPTATTATKAIPTTGPAETLTVLLSTIFTSALLFEVFQYWKVRRLPMRSN